MDRLYWQISVKAGKICVYCTGRYDGRLQNRQISHLRWKESGACSPKAGHSNSGAYVSLIQLVWHDESVGKCVLVLLQENFVVAHNYHNMKVCGHKEDFSF